MKRQALHALQNAINALIQDDPDARDTLPMLAGHVLEINLTPMAFQCFMEWTTHDVRCHAIMDQPADLCITGSPWAFMRLCRRSSHPASADAHDNIDFQGDLEFGQAVQKFFNQLHIDWEGHLATLTGDLVAYQIGSMVRQGQALSETLQHTLQENLADYIHEEKRLAPSREELNDFFNDVDELRLRVERLNANIQRLLQDTSHG